MKDAIVMILGLPFLIAGFLWQWIVRCFYGGQALFDLFDKL